MSSSHTAHKPYRPAASLANRFLQPPGWPGEPGGGSGPPAEHGVGFPRPPCSPRGDRGLAGVRPWRGEQGLRQIMAACPGSRSAQSWRNVGGLRSRGAGRSLHLAGLKDPLPRIVAWLGNTYREGGLQPSGGGVSPGGGGAGRRGREGLRGGVLPFNPSTASLCCSRLDRARSGKGRGRRPWRIQGVYRQSETHDLDDDVCPTELCGAAVYDGERI
jgi:hypothetical protein